MIRVLFTALLALLLSNASANASGADTFKRACQIAKARLIQAQTIYDSNGNVRTGPIYICVNEAKRKVSMIFIAASMTDHAFPDRDHAPWFSITLKNAQGQTLKDFPHLTMATTQSCKSYDEHMMVLEIPNGISLKAIDNAEARMSGSNNSLGCGQEPDRKVSNEQIAKIVGTTLKLLTAGSQ